MNGMSEIFMDAASAAYQQRARGMKLETPAVRP